MLECNTSCACDPARCTNRVVGRGPHPALQLVQTVDKGCGVITKTRLRPGQFVCEYAGEIIGTLNRFTRLRHFGSFSLTEKQNKMITIKKSPVYVNLKCMESKADIELVLHKRFPGTYHPLAFLLILYTSFILVNVEFMNHRSTCLVVGVDEATARNRFSVQQEHGAPNYILVLKEFGGTRLVSRTIVDPTGSV